MIDGMTGLLVGERSTQALAGAVVQILNEPERNARRGSLNGPAFVAERFSQDRMVDETIDVYNHA